MTTAEFLYTLEDGRLISESEILQPFMVYRRIKKRNYNYYVLMPKLRESGLKDIFILFVYGKQLYHHLYGGW